MTNEERADLEAAHDRLSSDAGYQFDLPPAPEPIAFDATQSSGSTWFGDIFNAIFDFFSAAAPLLKVLLIGAFIALVIYILYSLIKGAVDRRDQLKTALTGRDKPKEETDIRPDEAFSRDLLKQADDLARQGRYRDAIHLLLLTAIQDMQERLKQRIGVSLTAREIGRLGQMPDRARLALGHIIHTVEQVIFAEKDASESDYAQARDQYGTFAFGEGKT